EPQLSLEQEARFFDYGSCQVRCNAGSVPVSPNGTNPESPEKKCWISAEWPHNQMRNVNDCSPSGMKVCSRGPCDSRRTNETPPRTSFRTPLCSLYSVAVAWKKLKTSK